MTPAWGRWQRPAIFGGTGLGFAVIAFLPLLWPLLELARLGSGALAKGLEIYASAQLWMLMLRSLALASAVTAGALILGIPQGLLLARTDVAGRRALLLAQGLPMFLPPFVLALGWFYLFGRQGFLGGEASAGLLFHPFGHVAVLSLAFAPVATTLVALGIWNLAPGLEDAALVVARPGRVLTGILLPAVWPSIALAGILVFALAFSELGVPMFLRVEVYPAAVFSRLGGIDYAPGEAMLLALPLAPIAVAMAILERRLFRNRPFDAFGIQHKDRAPLQLGAWRMGLTVVCWALTLLSALPLAALSVRAGIGGGFNQMGRWIGDSVYNSLLGSALAATAIVGIGVILGHACARRLPGSRFLDLAGVLAFMAPAVLLGIGLIAIWNRPETFFIYGTIGIMILGHVARYGIIGIRALAIAVAQSPLSLEQAAAAFGAGYARRLARIVWPMQYRALGAAWFLAAVFCLRDLETAVLYYPPGREPLTVRIFTLEANGPESVVAGLAILHVALTASMLALGVWLLSRVKRP